MTVTQSKHEILWEPDTPREAVADAIASLRVDGLELDEFGMALMQRVANEEIDEEQAIAILLQQYRKWAATPTSTPAAASSATDLV